jgi:hypothetical protein
MALAASDPHPIPDDAREREAKYVLEVDAARRIWAEARRRLALDVWDPARPVAYHRTTYFDTPDLALHRRADGAARRLRIREYASAAAPGEPPVVARRCYAELKSSAGGVRTKARLEVDAAAARLGLAALAPGDLRPCLMTWYRRAAVASADRRLRLTLDRGLALCRPVRIGARCDGREPSTRFARGPALILEVKTREPWPAWLARVLAGVPPADGFSKFALGIRLARERGVLPGGRGRGRSATPAE